MSKISGIGLALGVALALGACGSTKEQDISAGKPVQAIYNEAVNALEAKNYNRAAKLFDDVEREHPYSVWATKAQLMAGYSHYQAANMTRRLSLSTGLSNCTRVIATSPMRVT